ncbi:zinc carboxypeptidase A 1-like [Pararge aegeria]|uniref:zinc carboxypeptidase A 1-like n=1 Tax=Pararge aegeria TaxID=116150 RepID=UPI0019D1D1CD|nr:zinc carboxypeptidase A 1-like [Pararge aegeria]
MKYINVMFWTKPSRLHNNVQVLVSPTDIHLFNERLKHFVLKGTVLSHDIQKLFDGQKVMSYTRMKADSFSWTSYHNLEGIYQWMTDIAAENSEKLNLTAIGLSAEGREILAIEFHNPKAKGTVIIEGGLHGNEWITTEFVTYLIYHIAKADKARNVKLQQVATKYRWILIPVANPDGYVYSMSNDRMWRKNRNKLGNGLVGVDLNRNFDYNFCSHDSSNKSTDDNYCGSRPFSEPETQAISNYVRRNSYNLKFYFSIHAYGQKIIVPYSDRVKHLENFSEIENYGKQAILQIYKLYRVKYGIGTIYDIYGYRSSGDSVSWVKKSYNVKYALTFLLRDNGTYGYALPPAMILPSCKEMLVGLLEVMTVHKMKLINLIIILFISAGKCLSKKYHNYTLYRGIPISEGHLNFFRNLSNLYDANYWREPGLVYRPTEFVIPPEYKMLFTRHALMEGIYYTTIMEDVQSAFDMQSVKTYIRRNMASFDWLSYFRLDDIYSWLQDLNHLYPQRIQIKNIGKSFEKRDILAVEVRLPSSTNRPKIIVEGGIHAREWISVAFATYFLHEIVTSPESNDTALKAAAERFEWSFVPVLNPDGYEYSHVKDRMYRKNMNGVDLNRNFGIEFGGIGTSSNRKSETYPGQYAFSEPESTAMGQYVESKSDKLQYYLAFHSYGQYLIIPYAFSSLHMDNYDEVYTMGLLAAKRIEQRYNTMYTVGTAYDTVGYKVSGVSGCWVKKSFSVP